MGIESNESVQNLLTSIRLQLIFTTPLMKTKINEYNVYVVKDPSKFLSLDMALDLLIKEFIEAIKSKPDLNLYPAYISLYYFTHRHHKSDARYPLNRLLWRLMKDIMESGDKEKGVQLTKSVRELIIRINENAGN